MTMRSTAAKPSGSITLADVELAVRTTPDLSEKRRRDYRSAVVRVAKLCDQEPAQMLLDFEAIQAKLEQINPVAAGISHKTYANIRYNFVRAVHVSGLKAVHVGGRRTPPLTSEWEYFRTRLWDRRTRFGLSNFVHYCSRTGIAPQEVSDTTISDFIAELRSTSLRRRPDKLHRATAVIWNDVVVRFPAATLTAVAIPSLWTRHRRLDWSTFPPSFLSDVEKCQAWFGRAERFSRHSRSRALAPGTLIVQRGYIHAIATSAVECGIPARSIRALNDLVKPDNFERILRWRDHAVGGAENAYNFFAAQCLYRIAKEWIKPAPKAMAEIERLARCVPRTQSGMTQKNRAILRQFDDPAVLRRLYTLPNRLLSDVRRQTLPNRHTLARAHMAIAIGILSHIPIRLHNLHMLEYDKHLLIRRGPGQKSYLCLTAKEVKNKYDIQFELPAHITKLLTEYRDEIAPKFYGQRPKKLFLGPSGSLKWRRGLGNQISAYLRRYVGIQMTPHIFRHLAGEIVLRTFPDGHVTVKDLLGHKSISTTLSYYLYMDSRRAGLVHQKALLEALPPDLQESIGRARGTNALQGPIK